MRITIQMTTLTTRGRKNIRKTEFGGTGWWINLGNRQEYHIGRSMSRDAWVMGMTPRETFTDIQWEVIFQAITAHYDQNDYPTLDNPFTVEI